MAIYDPQNFTPSEITCMGNGDGQAVKFSGFPEMNWPVKVSIGDKTAHITRRELHAIAAMFPLVERHPGEIPDAP